MRRFRFACLAGLLSMLSVRAGQTASADEAFAVIANKRSGSVSLSKAELKNIITGRMRAWPNNTIVATVLGPEDAAATKWLAETVCGVAAKTLLTKVKQEVFKGEMAKPLQASSDAQTLELVRSQGGAIGVVSGASAQGLSADLVLVTLKD